MKITGYTIIYFLLSMLLLWGFIEFEIWFYKKEWLKQKDKFIGVNLFIFTCIIIILWFGGYLEPIDKLLKKRIL
jgi:hypothetical protein